jgi:transcription antitermination protein NusB
MDISPVPKRHILMNETKRKSPSRAVAARHAARLAAVQALYQMEIADQSAPAVIAEFDADRLGLGPDGEPLEQTDGDLFRLIVRGVVDEQSNIDKALSDVLAAGWRLERVDSIARAILRAGCFEISNRTDIPVAGLIEAYVELAHQFLDEPTPGFVNGALDSLARKLRPGALEAQRAGSN